MACVCFCISESIRPHALLVHFIKNHLKITHLDVDGVWLGVLEVGDTLGFDVDGDTEGLYTAVSFCIIFDFMKDY